MPSLLINDAICDADCFPDMSLKCSTVISTMRLRDDRSDGFKL
jgi:hypothetical protein